ncbi:beta-ketoacyl synthase N-terminal-like domain-containing protein [Pontibacter cellulosilyticus]|uniref:Beta-ketoacyl-ACP reductase n=1 Tax=Pontibacter cellulosilyticus TaxID=1720253 RepID=A0A923N434_9BACT|nr:beta-ketoacyl synthase N-terminal-like domain-containing protein [Pontibacter cellulosilyticus]MBC5992505.1 beta-ketoacyl-ACP reductase [Pontibacter cellulosilyticus]
MAEAKKHIVIRGKGIISPLGHDVASVNAAYALGKPAFTTILHNNELTPVAALPAIAEEALQGLAKSNPNYRHLDRSVLMAVYAARQAASQAGWLNEESQTSVDYTSEDLAVNIGSSRGATGLFEQHYSSFQQSINGTTASSASPTTTLGNLSSWVAHAVNAGGAQISHSITCSTALMAVANGVAWLKASMAKRFLAGGTEAPLTPFTIAQMKAIGIYSKLAGAPYPCRPYNNQENTFVLGEGAAVFALELTDTAKLNKGDMVIEAVGFGFEKIISKTGISAEGQNFQKSMRHALSQLPADDQEIDLIISHTPGTKAGDKAELEAINTVFAGKKQPITTNKWILGHTLGASGALSLDYSLYLLDSCENLHIPKYFSKNFTQKNTINRILINAAGFGGNASSIIVKVIT